MRLTAICLGLAAALSMSSVAVAGTIGVDNLEIQITGLNLVYDGTDIVDAGSPAGGSGNPAEADQLTTMSFLYNGQLVGGIIGSDIYADVFIQDVLDIPAGGGVVTSGGNGGAFGVDLLTKDGDPAWGLALAIDQFQLFYSGQEITIATTGLASSVVTQNLPFGVEFFEDQPIAIVFSSANLSNVTTDAGFVTGFDAAGTGNISGNGIPEPATLTFLLAGSLVLTQVRRRR
jgi:hypothetical protein